MVKKYLLVSDLDKKIELDKINSVLSTCGAKFHYESLFLWMNTIYKRNTTEKQLQTITLCVSNS